MRSIPRPLRQPFGPGRTRSHPLRPRLRATESGRPRSTHSSDAKRNSLRVDPLASTTVAGQFIEATVARYLAPRAARSGHVRRRFDPPLSQGRNCRSRPHLIPAKTKISVAGTMRRCRERLAGRAADRGIWTLDGSAGAGLVDWPREGDVHVPERKAKRRHEAIVDGVAVSAPDPATDLRHRADRPCVPVS
jgi:hypothetical protein